MAFRRRKRFKKRRRRKRFKRFKRFKFKPGPMALRMVRSLKRNVGLVERKFVESSLIEAIGFKAQATPQLTMVWPLIGEGLGLNQRIGRKISVQQINFRGIVITNPASSAVNIVRFIMVRFPIDVGADVPTIDNFLTNHASGTEAVVSMYAKQTRADQQPYRIMLDRTMSLNYGGSNPTKNFVFSMKFKKPIVVSYQDSSNVVNSTTKNLMVLYIFASDSGVVASISYNWRMYYTDA